MQKEQQILEECMYCIRSRRRIYNFEDVENKPCLKKIIGVVVTAQIPRALSSG